MSAMLDHLDAKYPDEIDTFSLHSDAGGSDRYSALMDSLDAKYPPDADFGRSFEENRNKYSALMDKLDAKYPE